MAEVIPAGDAAQAYVEMQFHELFGVTETVTPAVYIADVDITDSTGTRFRTNYVSDPNDTFGLGTVIRQAVDAWILAGNLVSPYVPPPPQPYSLAIDTLWSRMTDLEATDFDDAMSVAQPLRLRRQFNTAMTMMSGSEIFAFTRGVLVTVVTETRADEILAE